MDTELNEKFRYYAAYGNLAEVRKLLASGANIDAIGPGRRADDIRAWSYASPRWLGDGTALHYAALYGKTAVVSFLLQEGANASLASEKGKTALEAAENSGKSDTADILRRHIERQAKGECTVKAEEEFKDLDPLTNESERKKSDEQKSDLKASIESPAVSPEIPVRSTSAPAPEQDLRSFLESLKLSKHFDFFVDSFGMECVEDFSLLEQGHWTQIQETLLHIPAKKLTKKLLDKGIINTSVFDPQTRQSDQLDKGIINTSVFDPQTRQSDQAERLVLPPGKQYAAFMSHKKEGHSEGIAVTIHEKLQVMYGLSSFFDADNLTGKQITEETLEEEVKKSVILVAVLDEKVNQSMWCRKEWEAAYRHGIPILPLFSSDLFNRMELGRIMTEIRDDGHEYVTTMKAVAYSVNNRDGAVNEIYKVIKMYL